MLALNTTHCGDCLELMKEIPDGIIDLVLTDPPYDYDGWSGGGSTPAYLGHIKAKNEISHIISGYDIPAFMEEVGRITKVFNAYIFCSSKQIPAILTEGYSRGLSVTILIWHIFQSRRPYPRPLPRIGHSWRCLYPNRSPVHRHRAFPRILPDC